MAWLQGRATDWLLFPQNQCWWHMASKGLVWRPPTLVVVRLRALEVWLDALE